MFLTRYRRNGRNQRYCFWSRDRVPYFNFCIHIGRNPCLAQCQGTFQRPYPEKVFQPYRVPVFMLATFLGMVPVTLILSYAGSQLGQVESFSVAAIFTPGMILSLCLLATFPFLAKGIVKLTRRYAKS